jgi:hypothetical protein
MTLTDIAGDAFFHGELRVRGADGSKREHHIRWKHNVAGQRRRSVRVLRPAEAGRYYRLRKTSG